MEYLLVMTFSGCTMTAACFLLCCLINNRISARLYYLLAKAAVLYYLIPLPFLKGWYVRVLRTIAPKVETEIAHIPLTQTSYTVDADGAIYLNSYAGKQIMIVGAWLLVAILLMAWQVFKYLRTAHWIAGYTSTKMTDRQKAYLDGLKEEYGIRRNVLLYQGELGASSMTFGIYRPVIICGREVGSREAELLIRHELVHIRRMDALWKMLMQFVIFLHWYNVFAWLLYFMFDRLCELSCDETVMLGRAKAEVKEYLLLLIGEAMASGEPRKTALRWQSGFGGNNKRKIQERVENLVRDKKWNKYAVGTLVAALVFANSMTVFAYKDTASETIQDDVSQENIETVLESDTVLFFSEDVEEEAMQDVDMKGTTEILYDRQFVDEEGNIYPIPETESHLGCNHDYESGTEQRHNKNSDGSCVVREYEAQRCRKCGHLVQGALLSSHYFATCPH